MVRLPHWPIPHGFKKSDFSLERVKDVLRCLGNPHHFLPLTIHVAGTNGKGSTVAYLSAIFKEAGYKVHRYISPHIVRFNERIMLADEEISDEFLHQVIEETRVAAGDLPLTFFEGTTVAAFLAFSKVQADVLLLETGMGGRLDATNIIEEPLLSIITPISDDHMEFLGDTIAKIAAEKAGIIKAGRPVILSWQPKEAYEVLAAKCNELQSFMYAWGEDWNFEKIEDGFNFIDLHSNVVTSFPDPALEGIHQIINSANVVAAVNIITQISDYEITQQNIHDGLRNAKWPARMEHIKIGVLANALPAGWELWVDGAHNNAGAEMIAAHIQNKWSDKPTFLINGRTHKRDIKSFLTYFLGKVQLVCGVKVQSEPLGELSENIYAGANELGFEAHVADSIKEAIDLIISKSSAPGRILVCGSLYLAGDLMLANAIS